MEKLAIGFFGLPISACRRQLSGFIVCMVGSALLLCLPLQDFIRHAVDSELNSHILLVPFISAYLVWTRKKTEPLNLDRAVAVSIAAAGAGLVFIGLRLFSEHAGWAPSANDRQVLFALGLIGVTIGAIFWFFGVDFARQNAFPIAFLVFAAPMPDFMVNAVTTFFQHASAEVSYWMIKLPGTTVFRQGLVFQLPGITIEVAPECSGIRSSFVLFITSLLAGYLFLKSPWKRTVLALAVIPLGILRNGVRIFTISMLCVHVDPAMIDSFIHRKGGPVFFLVSLIPLFLLLILLRKNEQSRRSGGVQS